MSRTHKPTFVETQEGERRPRGRRSRAGMTMVEIMVSVLIFAIAAGAVLSSFITTRKLAESNLSEAFAQCTAQSIIEQIIRVPPNILADEDATNAPVELRLPVLNTANQTTMPPFTLAWATDSTTYTTLGTAAQPAIGVLIDAAYIVASNTIRPEKYMKMRVNLQRTIQTAENRVLIVLRYQWEIPDRRGTSGAPIYLTGEIRTIRSTALRF